MEVAAKRRLVIIGSVAAALFIAGGIAFYYGPLKHQRWTKLHERNMLAISVVLRGQSGQFLESGKVFPRAIALTYDEGRNIAQAYYNAEREFTKQSVETVKVVAVSTRALKASNHVGLDAIRTQIKQTLKDQEAKTLVYSSVRQRLKDWQQ